jgi:transcription initiation factor TFIID subunit 1
MRKPLAAMLPEKFNGVDVRELFPEFRPGQVLRFSRLFPIKPSLRPRIWKNVKRRLKKKVDPNEKKDDDDSPESKEIKSKSGWSFIALNQIN